MAVKFGRSQIKNPTPANWAFAINIYMAVAGAITGWISSASYIPDKTSMVVSSILGLTITICVVLKPLIGVEVPQSYVAKEKVTEMENPETPDPNKP